MNDKELLIQCYKTMYQGMIKKDMNLLDKVLDKSFVLIHMTGMRQSKKQYMDYIAKGILNYYSEETEHIDIDIYNYTAHITGQSKVNAAVFGSNKHLWKLKISMKAIKNEKQWYITEAVASTY